jgi:histidyl-tRNA synthetase
MYSFEDRDDSSISLRPEATASVVRAYIEHGMQTRPGNVKLYYIGPMFRRERPQKGRYRQFYQIGAELLGPSDHPALDAEVIEMLLAFFERVNLRGSKLSINSIGDRNCRPAYVERLRGELQKLRERLGPDSQRRIETNPLRVLDSKLPEEQPIIDTLPHIAECLCEACRAHYEELKRQLALRKIEYEENWRLVRGLDYYMRTTFEITAPGLGSQNAVCGGGRYDGLVELLGGPAATKGIGFAIGTDRLLLSLQEAGATAGCGLQVFLAWFGADTYPAAVNLARKLREHGISVEVPAQEMKFGKSLSLADRLGARFAVILGEDELASGQFTVKRLADADQQKLAEADLLAYLTNSRTA